MGFRGCVTRNVALSDFFGGGGGQYKKNRIRLHYLAMLHTDGTTITQERQSKDIDLPTPVGILVMSVLSNTNEEVFPYKYKQSLRCG